MSRMVSTYHSGFMVLNRLDVPFRVIHHRFEQIGVQGNSSAFASFGLAVLHGQIDFEQIHPVPLKAEKIRHLLFWAEPRLAKRKI